MWWLSSDGEKVKQKTVFCLRLKKTTHTQSFVQHVFVRFPKRIPLFPLKFNPLFSAKQNMELAFKV